MGRERRDLRRRGVRWRVLWFEVRRRGQETQTWAQTRGLRTDRGVGAGRTDEEGAESRGRGRRSVDVAPTPST